MMNCIPKNVRSIFLLLMTLLSPHVILSQSDRGDDTLRVKQLVSECASKRPKTRLLLRSLVESEGRLAKFDSDSFYIKKGRKYFRSYFRDVLELRCEGKFVTNVPEPSAKPHGAWTDVNAVYAGTRILLVLTDGRTIKGFSNSASDTHAIIFDNKTDSRMDVPRDQVAAFFGLIGGNRGSRAGASKGSEGLLQPGGDPIVGGIGAGIGAIIGALMKSDGRPILVYSR